MASRARFDAGAGGGRRAGSKVCCGPRRSVCPARAIMCNGEGAACHLRWATTYAMLRCATTGLLSNGTMQSSACGRTGTWTCPVDNLRHQPLAPDPRASLLYSPTLLPILFNVKPSNTWCSAHLAISRRHHVAIVVSFWYAAAHSCVIRLGRLCRSDGGI